MHFDARVEAMRGDRAAANESAAADRGNDRIERADFAQQFEHRRALAGDDARVGVGMHERCAGLFAHGVGHRLARDDRRRAAVQRRAAGFDGFEFRRDRTFRHDDVRRDAARLRRERQRRAVIARGMRDDAARGCLVVERPHRVARTAELERAGALEVFAFEEQFRTGERIERARAQHGRDVRVRRDARGGGFDVGEVGRRLRSRRHGSRLRGRSAHDTRERRARASRRADESLAMPRASRYGVALSRRPPLR
jgi:hypothetical protein